MNGKPHDYNLRAIRNLLKQAFDATQLNSLCLDYYEHVYQKFNPQMQIDAKIDLLFKDCRKLPTGLDKLLAIVRREAPEVFKQFEKQLDAHDATVKRIPVVIFAMTSDEASQLITEEVFNDDHVSKAERTSFHKFRQHLKKQDIDVAELLTDYKESRDDWVPHSYQKAQKIQDIIKGMFWRINGRQEQKNVSILIEPQFCSADFFAEDDETHRLLRVSYCIFVLDSVSIFHPTLRDALMQSHLSASKRAVILVISPINSQEMAVNRFIEQELQTRIRQIFVRFDQELDKWCEFGLGDLRSFQRRLFTILWDKIAIFKEGQLSPNDRTLNSIWRKKDKPTGIHQPIFEQRGWQ